MSTLDRIEQRCKSRPYLHLEAEREVLPLIAVARAADDLRLWNPRGAGDERKGYLAAAKKLYDALAALDDA